MFLRRCALSLAAGLTLAALPAQAETDAPHAPSVSEARVMADRARELLLAEVGSSAAASAKSTAPRALTVLDLFNAKNQLRRELHALRASGELSEAGLTRMEQVVTELEQQLRAEHPSHFPSTNQGESNAGYDNQYRTPTVGTTAGYDKVYREPVKAIAVPATRIGTELRRLVDELLNGINAGTLSAEQRTELGQRIRELAQQVREQQGAEAPAAP